MIELKLPWPPSVNCYKKPGALRVTKMGKKYQTRVNTDATNEFYHDVWVLIQNLIAKEGLKTFDDETILLEAYVYLYPPDKRRRDIDNGLKLILDSLQRGGLVKNDYQIACLKVIRLPMIAGGQVTVRLKPLEIDDACERS